MEGFGGVVLTGRSDGGEESVVGEVFPGGGGFGGEMGSGHKSVWFGGGKGGEDEDWGSSSMGNFDSSVSLLDLDWDEDSDDETKEWEIVEATSTGAKTVRDEVIIGGDKTTRRSAGEVAGQGGWSDFAKRSLIAGGARVLFYPTLLRNVAMDKIYSDFHWFDAIDQNVVLGAVPFRSHLPELLELGVRAVVTLTEPFETLIHTSRYQAHGIDHLEIPTPDYSAAPSIEDICTALSFMHVHALRGDSIYVHCKAGRGRSTTIVQCYLIKYKDLTPDDAWTRIKAIRPRVSLTAAQKEAVTRFYKLLQSSDPLSESLMLVDDANLMGHKNDGAHMDSSEEIRSDP